MSPYDYPDRRAEGRLRLVGGTHAFEGRVEVYHDGAWGTVCDDSWGFEEAEVVCRQLGRVRAISHHCCAEYGAGSGTIWMDNVACNGDEPDRAHV